MRLAALLLPLSVTFTLPALAYVPPGNFIVKTLAQKHASAKPVRLRAMVTAWEGAQPGATRFKEVAAFNPATRTMRSVALDPVSGKALFSIERSYADMSVVSSVLFDPNPRTLISELRERGVAIKPEEELLHLKSEEERIASDTTHLGRGGPTGNQVSWVIGKRDKSAPQLWVEKDTFLPLRVSYSAGAFSGQVEALFETPRIHGEFAYPKAITVQLKGEPAMKAEVSELSAGAPEAWAELKNAAAPGWTEAGNAAPEPLRNLIEAYYQIVR